MVVRSPLRRSPLKVGFLLYLTVTCLVTYLHHSVLVCVVILGDSLMVLQVLGKIQKKSFPRRKPAWNVPGAIFIQERMRTDTKSAQNQPKAQYSTFSSECSNLFTESEPGMGRAFVD